MSAPAAIGGLLDEWFAANKSGPAEAATSDEPRSATPSGGTNMSMIAPVADFKPEVAAAFAAAAPCWAFDQSDNYGASDRAPVRVWSTTILKEDGVLVELSRDDVWAGERVAIGQPVLRVWAGADDSVTLPARSDVARLGVTLLEAARLLTLVEPLLADCSGV